MGEFEVGEQQGREALTWEQGTGKSRKKAVNCTNSPLDTVHSYGRCKDSHIWSGGFRYILAEARGDAGKECPAYSRCYQGGVHGVSS